MPRKKQFVLSIDQDVKETVICALKCYQKALTERRNQYDGSAFSALFQHQLQAIEQVLTQLKQQTTKPLLPAVSSEEKNHLLKAFWELAQGKMGVFCGFTESMELVEVRYERPKGFVLRVDGAVKLETHDINRVAETFWQLANNYVG